MGHRLRRGPHERHDLDGRHGGVGGIGWLRLPDTAAATTTSAAASRAAASASAPATAAATTAAPSTTAASAASSAASSSSATATILTAQVRRAERGRPEAGEGKVETQESPLPHRQDHSQALEGRDERPCDPSIAEGKRQEASERLQSPADAGKGSLIRPARIARAS